MQGLATEQLLLDHEEQFEQNRLLTAKLEALYGAPVEMLRDHDGTTFVAG